MNGSQKAIVVSLIATSSVAWIASMQQPDMMMMAAMTTYDPLAISLFTASWTAGMAAMMFPAITPMVLLYGKFITNEENRGSQGSASLAVYEEGKPQGAIYPLIKSRALYRQLSLCLGGNWRWSSSRVVGYDEQYDNDSS